MATARRAAVCLLFAAACSKDAAEITKEYRPKAEPRMQKLVAAIKSYPSVEKAPIDKLRFSGDNANALLAQQSWLDGTPDDRNELIARVGAIRNVQDALRGAEPIPSSYNWEPDFKAFLAAKYAVLASVNITPAMPDGDTFVGGQGTLRLSIFEIDSGKKVESIELESGAADKVLVAQGKESQGIEAETMRGLRLLANNAITPYLAPGEKPPF